MLSVLATFQNPIAVVAIAEIFYKRFIIVSLQFDE